MTSLPSDTETQADVFAFFGDPGRAIGVRRIDTHAASVFLEKDRAFKIKRAVRFPFLDYSTLEKRKAACEDEIRINRPLAPDIYRRVVGITRAADGTLSIGGTGQPVEYAVEMMRFDDDQTFDNLAHRGELTGALAEGLAQAIAASHDVAVKRPVPPWISSIPVLIQAYIAAFKAGPWFTSGDIDELAKSSQAAFARLKPLLEERGNQGYVRRCHGDLHLANVVLIAQRPVLFDAIEFDERIASIDVLYDLAFPLMDMLCYEQASAANRLLNRYLAQTPSDHLHGLAALPLFMSMRSAIRAQVLLARLNRPNGDQAAILQAATRYFELAHGLIHPAPPRLVAVGGLSGTGKSVLSRGIAPSLAPSPGAVVLRSDVLRKRLFSAGQAARLPSSAYDEDSSRKVYNLIIDDAARTLSAGFSVVADAVFARETERKAIADLARQQNVPFVGLFLTADVSIRQARIGARVDDASDATADVAGQQERYHLGTIDWSIIDASGTADSTLAQSRARLGEA